MIKEGLYKVEISGFGTRANGVAVLYKATLLGGDSSYYFAGTITERRGRMTAVIRAKRHSGDVRSTFGPLSDLTFELSGGHDGSTATLRGIAKEMQAVSVQLVMSPILLEDALPSGAHWSGA